MQPGTLWRSPLDLKGICDICKRPRSSGNNKLKHTKCSRIRQMNYMRQANHETGS